MNIQDIVSINLHVTKSLFLQARDSIFLAIEIEELSFFVPA